MIALEIVKDQQTKKPDPELTSRITRKAWKGGAIILQAGVDGNVLRFPMPLVMTDEQLQKGLDILEEAMRKRPAEPPETMDGPVGPHGGAVYAASVSRRWPATSTRWKYTTTSNCRRAATVGRTRS